MVVGARSLKRRLRGAYVDDPLSVLMPRLTSPLVRSVTKVSPRGSASLVAAEAGPGRTRTQARGGAACRDGRLQECATTLVHEGLLGALDYTLRMQGPPREPRARRRREARRSSAACAPAARRREGGARRERVHDGGAAELPRDGGHQPQRGHVHAVEEGRRRREPRSRGSNGRLAATNTNEAGDRDRREHGAGPAGEQKADESPW